MEGDLRVGSVVIDCNDFPTMSRFWQEALRYVPREDPEDDWVVLRDPEGHNVQVSIQVVPEARSARTDFTSISTRAISPQRSIASST